MQSGAALVASGGAGCSRIIFTLADTHRYTEVKADEERSHDVASQLGLAPAVSSRMRPL